MRALILRIHLWIGLTAGAVLAFVGLTGSLYVFQPELTVALYPELYKASKPESAPVEVRTIVQNAEAQFGGKVTNINFPVRELENYILKVKGNKQWLFFDAGTGLYLGQMEKRRGLLDDLLDLHRHLTLGEAGSGITGTCALLLAFVLLSSGLFLWLPKKRRQLKDGLRLKPGASFKRRNYDIHNVFGFYFGLPLFLAAITGAYFAFPNGTQKTVDTLTLAQEETPDVKKLKSEYRADAEALTVYQALDLMEGRYGTYVKRTLVMPADSVGHIAFTYLREKGLAAGPQYRPMVYLDQYDGSILYEYNPVTAPTGRQIVRNWFVPIHFGEIGGFLTRVLWFILGLLPGVLWVTGILIWTGKNKKKKRSLPVSAGRGAVA